MAAGWILHALYASLLSQAGLHNSPKPPSGQDPTDVFRPVVRTTYGELRGIQKKASSNVLIDTYLGIPYATPPVGKLRFTKPLPATKWTGVRDASSFGNECFQQTFPSLAIQPLEKPLAITEDCLYLNIYKPVSASNDPLPVMVWIHGGAYFLGAGSQYDGTELAAKGVIVVTINYRLDIFGFLSNEDDVIPGNYGMLDQVMALKWVNANIRSFGGDPDKVTIFGESAGSSSVSLLVLSPLASGLFKQAIMESGTSLSSWAVQHPTTRVVPRQMVSLIGSIVGCSENDAVKNLECFRNTDAETLFNASVGVQHALGGGIQFTPVVETAFGFLTDLPLRLWTQNKFNHVNTIRGFNTAEEASSYRVTFGKISYTNQTFIEGLRRTFKPYSLPDQDKLITEILQTHDKKETDEKKIFLNYIYALSDLEFKGPALIEANIESKLAPEKAHYVYEFEHRPYIDDNFSWLPAYHGEELLFVFGIHAKYSVDINWKTPSTEDQIVEKEMQTLWSNFAKYGDPTKTVPSGGVKWDNFNSKDAKVLKINAASQLLSYKNHTAFYTFPKFFKRLDTAIPDEFVIG